MSDKYRLNIVFYVNGMQFDGDSLNRHSLGGSETAGLCMAREMAKRGHDVTMFCNTERPGKYDGVNYLPIQSFQPYMIYTSTDVLIVQRVPQIFGTQMKSKINILWQHDLALKRMRKEFRGALWNVDEVWGLSDFHINQMSEVYGVPKDVFWKTRNGIDPTKMKNLNRYPKRLIYTARPERGMDILLFEIMPRIWKRDPEVELYLAGYDNTVPEMRSFYDSIHAKIKEYMMRRKPIKWLGPLSKKDLYQNYQKAMLYVYPTNFEEISCIIAMECMACGLPMIGTKLAALPETLDLGAGILINGDAKSKKYQQEFVNTVLDLLNDQSKLRSLREAGIKTAQRYLWSDLAKDWEEHFYGLFEQRSANKKTLAKHFYRNEDIMALKHLDIPEWNYRIEKEYPILKNTEAYRDLYVKMGKETAININGIQEYTRIRVAIDIISQHGKPSYILDFGGGIGNEAIRFVNAFGCDVVSVDISPEQQEKGKELAQKYCKHPKKIDWVLANHPSKCKHPNDYFDVVFAGEVLEHQVEPWKLVDELEKKCKPGGLILFTVPFGPWGDVQEGVNIFRGHLWNFEKSDLKDMFGQKKNLSVKMVGGPVNEKNKETLGWYVVSYVKDSEKATNKINLDRKVMIQAPRQTVSACMIIGGKQEGLLYRCLESIYGMADEIIICDTGMSKECIEILSANKYKDKITIISNAPDPLKMGFDEARNAGLRHAKSDWVFWIDSDEELLTPKNIFKYLRHNHYNGYSIRQHHFSAQPPNAFKPDLPIRLFRNHKGIKFFGVVHEHPEIEINKGVGEITVLSDVDIAHNGYFTEEGRRKKFNRNFRLLLKDREKHPDRILGKFLIMRDWILLSRYTLEKTKGQLTPEVVEYCNNVIEMYRSEFLDKNIMMSHDGLGYYSEALEILNRGLEYTFNFNIKPRNAIIESDDITARFESEKDFLKYIGTKIEVMKEPFEGRYV
jgi:glycosyltransferase involved in cell wall biosynthesis/2-polyprenyl-3-methyl-5-hydroxy-6-metoxy-1,4-benzoquinol methylase